MKVAFNRKHIYYIIICFLLYEVLCDIILYDEYLKSILSQTEVIANKLFNFDTLFNRCLLSNLYD